MLSQSEVEVRLAPYVPGMQQVVLKAWMDWMASGHNGIWTCKRSRAAYVWEQMVLEAKRQFAGDRKVSILRKNESFLFLMDELVFRFKKSDPYGYTSNVPTQAALDYHDPQEDLPGVPSVQRLEITYVLNKLETAVQDILLVARDQDRVLWRSSILRDDDGAHVVPITVSRPPQSPAPASQTIKIPVKSKHAKKNENES
jgi:hypothetical protein